MKRSLIAVALSVFLALSACAPEPAPVSDPKSASQPAKTSKSGFGKAMVGLANLVLSPLQIAAGVLEGIASVPFYLSMNVQQIDKGLQAANAKVTLDDTYESAYGKRISAVPEDGDTGEVFRRMKHATEYFQKILVKYGVPNAKHYILTSIDTANDMGYTLFAVVYRPLDTISVLDKYDGKTPRTFSRDDRLYYEPFETDMNGRPLDIIVDWSGLPRELIQTQKGQAVLLTMAANAVVDKKRSTDYWPSEKSWIAGEFRTIVEQKMNSVRNKMKI